MLQVKFKAIEMNMFEGIIRRRSRTVNTRNPQVGCHLYYLNEAYIGLHHNQGFICSTEMCEPTWAKMYTFLC